MDIEKTRAAVAILRKAASEAGVAADEPETEALFTLFDAIVEIQERALFNDGHHGL